MKATLGCGNMCSWCHPEGLLYAAPSDSTNQPWWEQIWVQRSLCRTPGLQESKVWGRRGPRRGPVVPPLCHVGISFDGDVNYLLKGRPDRHCRGGGDRRRPYSHAVTRKETGWFQIAAAAIRDRLPLLQGRNGHTSASSLFLRRWLILSRWNGPCPLPQIIPTPRSF